MVRRVLIIDDEEDIRSVAQVSLEIVGGWEVFTAKSGAEGLATAAAERPDAVLLDFMMPDMDGPMTYRNLQASDETRHIPVVMLTAKVQATDRRKMVELGVQGVIAKPFDPMRLSHEVAKTLGWKD